jgi:hypothetical protein
MRTSFMLPLPVGHQEEATYVKVMLAAVASMTQCEDLSVLLIKAIELKSIRKKVLGFHLREMPKLLT